MTLVDRAPRPQARPRPQRTIDARRQAAVAKVAAVEKAVKALGRTGAPITRAASPFRLEPMAAIRSPSTATSAATLGAPLPSTTVPPLMRSDQAIALLLAGPIAVVSSTQPSPYTHVRLGPTPPWGLV